MRGPKTISEWMKLGDQSLKKLLKKAQSEPSVRRLLTSRKAWQVELQMVGGPAMVKLNRRYRGKAKLTDVLSFSAPEIFTQHGLLGELVVCVPVLKRQARELGHSEVQELEVLLAHGLLHLLGLDHEKSAKEAARMAKFEALLLRGSSGLIRRTG